MNSADREGKFYEDLEVFLSEHELCGDLIDSEGPSEADNGLWRMRAICKGCGAVLDGTYDLDENHARLLKLGKLGGLTAAETEALLSTTEGTAEFYRRVRGTPGVLGYHARMFARADARIKRQ